MSILLLVETSPRPAATPLPRGEGTVGQVSW